MHVIYNKHTHSSSARLTNKFYNDLTAITTETETTTLSYNVNLKNKTKQKPLNLQIPRDGDTEQTPHVQNIKGGSGAAHHSNLNKPPIPSEPPK